MKPRQIVHTLLIISEILLYASLLSISIIGCVKKDRKKKIWFASKILTLKQIIIDNMYNTYPLKDISENSTEYYNNSNYNYYLLHSTKTECEGNYKKCGILDTMNNIMCIPTTEICPLNEIKTSLNENSNIYETVEYFDYNLYFTNQNINNSIITNLTISYGQPKYITTKNFIFDLDTYIDETTFSGGGSSYDYDYGGHHHDYDGGGGDGGGGGGGGGIGDGGGGWRNLDYKDDYGDSDVKDYILEKFEETINIDLNYKKIDNNLYRRNYIGFENYKQMEEFINTDFRYYYKLKFPKTFLIVFGFISTLPLFILICFAICRLNYEDMPYSPPPNRCDVILSKFCVIFWYMVFFLLFYIFCIINYCDLHKGKINCNSLKKIKSETIIKDLIYNFCYDYNSKNKFVITEIILLSISFFIFFIGWIAHIIIQILIDTGRLQYK